MPAREDDPVEILRDMYRDVQKMQRALQRQELDALQNELLPGFIERLKVAGPQVSELYRRYEEQEEKLEEMRGALEEIHNVLQQAGIGNPSQADELQP